MQKLRPVNDPESTKYPDRVFYVDRWMTQEQIERGRERDRKRKHKQYATDSEFRERELERRLEQKRLKRLTARCADDPNRVLFSSKLHGLVELATRGATNHEKAAARAALRKRGLI